jgi:DNA-binding SARP family transcriptional activator
MTMLKLRLFGGFELTGAVGPPLPTRKAEALLAYLAVSADRAHRRDKLAALLWGDRGDVQARRNLAQTLYVIRRTLGRRGRNALVVNSRSVMLDSSRIEIDVGKFESFVAERTPISLGKAVGLFQDEMLVGFYLPEDAFEEWLLGEQRRLLNKAIVALEMLLSHQFDDLDDAAAIETAQRLLALDPLQEPVHRTLMRLQHRAGSKGAAVRQYRACVKVLRLELDTTPDEATDALYHEIVSDRSSATERRRSQYSDTANHESDGTAYPFFPTRDNRIQLKTSLPHVIDLHGDYKLPDPRLDWIQVKDINQGWTFKSEVSQNSVSEKLKPGLYSVRNFGKAIETLRAIFLRMKPGEQEAAERRRRYYDRTLVIPPSMSHDSRSALPGGIIIPGFIHR